MGKKVLTMALALTLCLGCFALNGCKEKKEPTLEKFDLTPFVGVWECEDNPLNDPGYYTGFLKMEIKENGEFSLYDAEAGNPGVAGKLTLTGDDTLELNCEVEDFDAPPNWSTMGKQQQINYKFKSEEKLYLTYTDEETGESSTLIFCWVKK